MTPITGSQRLSPGLWIAAAIEIAVAIAVSAIILRVGVAPSAAGHSDTDMTSMESHRPMEIHWHAATLLTAGLTALVAAWWMTSRKRVPAILTAAGLVGLGLSDTVRTIAVQSHVIGMAALEVLFVAVPLLLIAALPRQTSAAGRSPLWTGWVILAVLLNSALLIALHLPAVHDRGMQLGTVPLWLGLLVLAVGIAYWSAILVTAGRVGPALRRGALIVGQEVGAILGLATLLGTGHDLDQRLGGAVMLATCAAVTLPLAKRLEKQQLRTESDVH
jgi:cytochrome c oxidase assembly factor CtaG